MARKVGHIYGTFLGVPINARRKGRSRSPHGRRRVRLWSSVAPGVFGFLAKIFRTSYAHGNSRRVRLYEVRRRRS